MPPVTLESRFFSVNAFNDDDSKKALESYIAFRFDNAPGTQYIDVQEGDTLHHLSDRLYGTTDFWWVLADFNGILDPTQRLDAGRTIRAPLREQILIEIIGV